MRTKSRLEAALAGLVLAGSAHATTETFGSPDFDRWNYPFNVTPGTRGAAPTFSAIGAGSFDERDGQFLIGFDTSAALPALPAGLTYQINAVTVTATHSTGAFAYDPTYDGFATFNGSAADADAGRPIVLTGAGLRGGFIGLTTGFDAPGPPFYGEAEAFAFGPPTASDVRNAFAAAFDGGGNLVDISNNVRDGFDFTPFAVGTTGLNPGDTVVEGVPNTSAGSTFTFDVDLGDANILGYIEDGVATGGLFFSITSLHTAGQSGGSNPNFYTADSPDTAAVAPTLSIDFTVVPEPATAALGLTVLPLIARRRKATRLN